MVIIWLIYGDIHVTVMDYKKPGADETPTALRWRWSCGHRGTWPGHSGAKPPGPLGQPWKWISWKL